jgi:hypothetical protein
LKSKREKAKERAKQKQGVKDIVQVKGGLAQHVPRAHIQEESQQSATPSTESPGPARDETISKLQSRQIAIPRSRSALSLATAKAVDEKRTEVAEKPCEKETETPPGCSNMAAKDAATTEATDIVLLKEHREDSVTRNSESPDKEEGVTRIFNFPVVKGQTDASFTGIVQIDPSNVGLDAKKFARFVNSVRGTSMSFDTIQHLRRRTLALH